MNKSIFVTAKKIKEEYGLSSGTLRNWDKGGRVETIRTPGGKRLYRYTNIVELLQKEVSDGSSTPRAKVCYVRVSSPEHKQELDKQIQDLRKAFPGHEIVSEVASGLNFKRPHFNSLLDRVLKGDIEQLVVTHRDRLCRFGFELIERVCKTFGTEIVVQCSTENTEGDIDSTELSEDLLSIVSVFVAKNNGYRSAESRRRKKRERETDEEKTSGEQEAETPTRKRSKVASREGHQSEVVPQL